MPVVSPNDTDETNNSRVPNLNDLTLQSVSEQTPTSSTYDEQSSPVFGEDDATLDEATAPGPKKKKKKKKPKKSAKAKSEAAAAAATNKSKNSESADNEGRPAVLCISRNKHWRYISSYHGPWLQLPLELLESLLVLNLDPTTLTSAESRLPALPPPALHHHRQHSSSTSSGKQRDRGFHGLGDYSPPDSPRGSYAHTPLPSPFPPPKVGKATPPPIDPGVFRSVTSIRRLIDEAAELSVRASSGLSAAELGSLRGAGGGMNNNPWATAQSLGINPLGGSNGRNVAMSAMRIHRLRALAVQKLAQAYKADEIASSVMIMQGGSVFDDIAERVLKTDPNDIDAKYVHFFHEKIPSRQLAESTTTQVLDELIAAQPQRLEFYRTRGIVHCFRDEFPEATKDFTFALKEARAIRKARTIHRTNAQKETRGNKSKRKKGGTHTNGRAPQDGTGVLMSDYAVEGPDGEPLLLHSSVLPDAPEPIEPQLLFFRGAAYLQQAVHMVETAVLGIEGISKAPSMDGSELRLRHIGKYGGVEVDNPDGPLGNADGAKLQAYAAVLGQERFKEQITNLLQKCIRDHERFLAHFDSLDSPGSVPDSDIASQTEYAFLLSESSRPGNHSNLPPPMPDVPAMFTTYHPLLVESRFSILLAKLMLADFPGILPTFVRTACLVDGLEGYPIFLPPRSMGQADFIEVLERLAGGWRNGTYPHSLAVRGKARLAIEGPTKPPPPPPLFISSASRVYEVPLFPEDPEEHAVPSSPSSSCSSSSSNMTATMATVSRMNSVDFGVGASSSSSSSTPSSSYFIPPASAVASTSGSSSRSGSSGSSNNGDGSGGPTSPICPPTPTPTQTTTTNATSASGSASTFASTSASASWNPEAAHVLDCARILLAPVVKRRKARAANENSKGSGNGSGGGGGVGGGGGATTGNGGGSGNGDGSGNGGNGNGKKKPTPINIPLHGPRVEIVLAWLGAVHLPALGG